VSGRTEAFTLATRSLQGHLATGVGPRRAGIAMDALGHSGPSYSHAHDLWPTWLLETGVVGFAAMALITLGGLVAAARTGRPGIRLVWQGSPRLPGSAS
jgi:O-antigen ligase